MKNILTGLLLLIYFTAFSQTVNELEHELSYFKSDKEWGNKKDIAFKLLEIDKLNAKAIKGGTSNKVNTQHGIFFNFPLFIGFARILKHLFNTSNAA